MSPAECGRRIAAVMLCAASACHGAHADPRAEIVQRDRRFDRAAITIDHGATLRFANRDEFGHQIYVESPAFAFDSDETEPGGRLDVVFPEPGQFQVHCHIHPKMSLTVTVR